MKRQWSERTGTRERVCNKASVRGKYFGLSPTVTHLTRIHRHHLRSRSRFWHTIYIAMMAENLKEFFYVIAPFYVIQKFTPEAERVELLAFSGSVSVGRDGICRDAFEASPQKHIKIIKQESAALCR
jgi:hypothetical protein